MNMIVPRNNDSCPETSFQGTRNNPFDEQIIIKNDDSLFLKVILEFLYDARTRIYVCIVHESARAIYEEQYFQICTLGAT